MNFWNELVQTITAMGGAAVIAGAFAAWLSKVFANRNLERMKSRLNRELEQRKADMRLGVEKELAELNNELAILREKTLTTHRDKIELYQSVSEPLIDLVNRIECEQNLAENILVEFNRQRLQIHARLVLFAPQNVLDAYDAFVDYVFDSLERPNRYDWSVIRSRGLKLLNEMRADIGMATGDALYKGNR